MILIWDFYWPAIVLGLAIGAVSGLWLLRPIESADRRSARNKRRLTFAGVIAAAVAATALWHGPLGAADRFAGTVETATRAELARLEMTQVQARLGRDPLTRRLALSGPADDFQRRELSRILREMPGVAGVRWVGSRARGVTLPLLLEAELMALVAFSLGLLLAYLIEIRRRARAEWSW